MNDQKPEDGVVGPLDGLGQVGGGRPGKTSVAVPEEKKKRGRPKKEGVEVGKKQRRDAFAEAFGDKRAATAVKGLPKGQEKKDIVAAVKALGGAQKKLAKLEAVKTKLAERVHKAEDKLAKVCAQIEDLSASRTKIDSVKVRVGHLIQTIYNLSENPLAQKATV